MTTIGIRELRRHASRYLAKVEAGEEISIPNRGKTVARPPRLPHMVTRTVIHGVHAGADHYGVTTPSSTACRPMWISSSSTSWERRLRQTPKR